MNEFLFAAIYMHFKMIPGKHSLLHTTDVVVAHLLLYRGNTGRFCLQVMTLPVDLC